MSFFDPDNTNAYGAILNLDDSELEALAEIDNGAGFGNFALDTADIKSLGEFCSAIAQDAQRLSIQVDKEAGSLTGEDRREAYKAANDLDAVANLATACVNTVVLMAEYDPEGLAIVSSTFGRTIQGVIDQAVVNYENRRVGPDLTGDSGAFGVNPNAEYSDGWVDRTFDEIAARASQGQATTGEQVQEIAQRNLVEQRPNGDAGQPVELDNSAFGGLTRDENRAVEAALDELYNRVGATNPGSPQGIATRIDAGELASSIKEVFGEKLTARQLEDLDYLIGVGRSNIQQGQSVAERAQQFLNSITEFNNNNWDSERSVNERAEINATALNQFLSTLTKEERAALQVTNPQIAADLDSIRADISASGIGIFGSPEALIRVPGGPNDRVSDINLENIVDGLVARVIAERGSITEAEFDEIQNFVSTTYRVEQQRQVIEGSQVVPRDQLPISAQIQARDAEAGPAYSGFPLGQFADEAFLPFSAAVDNRVNSQVAAILARGEYPTEAQLEAIQRSAVAETRSAGGPTPVDTGQTQSAVGRSSRPAQPGTREWEIQNQVGRLKTDVELRAWLATTTYTAAEINAAYPEYATADLQRVINEAKADGRADPLNASQANLYADQSQTQQFGNYVLPKPVRVDEQGNPIYALQDPALKAAQAIVAADTKLAWERAVREIYDRYNVSDRSIIVSAPGADGYPEIQIKLSNGELVSVPTGSYFAGIPKIIAGDQFFFAQPRPLFEFETGYADRVVKITPPLQTAVAIQLPTGQNIVVDPNSELARYIQYLGTQNNSLLQRPFAEIWAEGGVTDPYTDPATVQYAIDALARVNARADYLRANGFTPPESFWNDPNWPRYVGTSKEAFEQAVRALEDPAYRASLIASNGWSQADYESWSLSVLNPEESARRTAEAEAARGVVAGPGSSGSGSSKYVLSTNKATVAEIKNGAFNPQGAPIIDYSKTSALDGVDAAALAAQTSADAARQLAGELIGKIQTSAPPLPSGLSPFVTAATSAFGIPSLTGLDNLFGNQAATIALARQQAQFQARYNQASSSDWRLRLSLAPGATYLYKDQNAGILAPLYQTDGVIFPYTPQIETSYSASYEKYDLVHSNYRGYFYKGSGVNEIQIRGTFTAQDTPEAGYLLAVIHFFRSITKMFYGQDALRGAPPPLVYLTGYGDFQFNNHPCLVSNFNYSLPSDVDYIRALAPNNYGNLFVKRFPSSLLNASRLLDLAAQGVTEGADLLRSAQNLTTQFSNNTTNANYVPTKMEINITLLPVNTRAQVSQQFSLKEFANGNLIKKGFW